MYVNVRMHLEDSAYLHVKTSAKVPCFDDPMVVFLLIFPVLEAGDKLKQLSFKVEGGRKPGWASLLLAPLPTTGHCQEVLDGDHILTGKLVDPAAWHLLAQGFKVFEVGGEPEHVCIRHPLHHLKPWMRQVSVDELIL